MKLIDEKGRLFGRINLLDLAVIIGALAVLYVGASAWIALRQDPLAITGLEPSQITTGKPVNIAVNLQNERYINSARLHLISDQPGAETTIITGKVLPSVRHQATFSIPADLPAGNYSLAIEAQLMDVFRRSSLQTIGGGKLRLVVADEIREIVEETAYDPRCLWKLELNTVLLSGGNSQPELETGNSLESNDGMSLTLVEFKPDVPDQTLDMLPDDIREKVIAMAALEVTATFEHLEPMLAGLESSMALSSNDSRLEAVTEGIIYAELDMLFYLENDNQAGLLKKDATLATDSQQAAAIVLENFGQVDNPWVSAATLPPEGNNSPVFSVARVRLACRPDNGGLYYGSTRLEPNGLLSFGSGDSKITGGILSSTIPSMTATVRAMLDNVPVHLVPLIKSGVKVTNHKGNVIGGTIRRVLNVDRLALLPSSLGYNQGGIGRDFRRILLELELECISRNGALLFQGQLLDYGKPINFALLGRPYTAISYLGSTLPARGKLADVKIQVVFHNVPTEIVPWIRAGEQEYIRGRTSNWKIERVMSNEPAKVMYSGADGRQAHLANHPSARNIRCLVSLRLVKYGEDMFFNGSQLKIGSNIAFSAKRWTHSASLAAF